MCEIYNLVITGTLFYISLETRSLGSHLIERPKNLIAHVFISKQHRTSCQGKRAMRGLNASCDDELIIRIKLKIQQQQTEINRMKCDTTELQQPEKKDEHSQLRSKIGFKY